MSARPFVRLAAATASAALLAGCAAPNIEAALKEAGELATPVARGAKAELFRDDAQREAASRLASELLAKPLSQDGAVQLALANSPAFQAALAQSWGEMAQAQQRGLPGGVLFSFERLREGAGLEIGRLLSFGLFDLITLPRRRMVSRIESEQARVRMAGSIVDHVSATRQAWVRAVAARETLTYAGQVRDAADASAELARRLQRVGNFTKLQAARQHLFYADATSRLAAAQHAAASTREELVRTGSALQDIIATEPDQDVVAAQTEDLVRGSRALELGVRRIGAFDDGHDRPTTSCRPQSSTATRRMIGGHCFSPMSSNRACST